MSRKNVMITGAKGGMGKAFVESFAKAGYNIVACIREENNEFSTFVNSIIKQYEVDIYQCYFDVKDNIKMKSEVMRIIKEIGSIDVLINNAGIAHAGYLSMTKVETIREIFEVNYFSYLELTQLVLKRMIRNKRGSIINMSSIAADDMKAGNSAYGASKAAVTAWTKTLAAEVAPFGIRVNALAPGMIDTSMSNTWNVEAAIQMSDMKRLAEPMEIAEVALFLASDEASFINGQTIRINGGG